MTGSEKQIQWATKIQQQFIGEVRQWHASNAKAAAQAGQTAQWDAAIADVIAQAEAETRAAWWIDNRAKTGFKGEVWAAMYTAAVERVKEAV